MQWLLRRLLMGELSVKEQMRELLAKYPGGIDG